MSKIALLDCTLRDGAYINGSQFGEQTIGGIIKRLQDANVDIIECGWLKDSQHVHGSSYYHVPNDLNQYLIANKREGAMYVAMIDYNRYDIANLTDNDGTNIDSIRVVFPHGKFSEAQKLIQPILNKGYKVFLQAANTLSYSDDDLKQLADEVNKYQPVGLSIVDTFGAMYPDDIMRITKILDECLDNSIKLGFHSHNNQQLSFALSIKFVQEMMDKSQRNIIIDSSLCGMGRGAGNTNTELITNYLNRTYHTDYDLNVIMDAIDVYMLPFMRKYSWGYSIPYYIAGMYETHVNNVAYLQETHAVKNKDMKIIFSSMGVEQRRKYDYDYLEQIYTSYSNNVVDDQAVIDRLTTLFNGKNIVATLPGKSAHEQKERILQYIHDNEAITIGINTILPEFNYDYLFFTSEKKYEFAKEKAKDIFDRSVKIITSNVKTNQDGQELILNYNDLLKFGWKFYDNSMLLFLRLLKKLMPNQLAIAGFDGYNGLYTDNYAPDTIKGDLSAKDTLQLQNDIEDMLADFAKSFENKFDIHFITPSPFEKILHNHII